MNANELADYLDNNVEAMIMSEQTHIDQAAIMLRQQQEQINNLKQWEKRQLDLIETQQAEIEALKNRNWDLVSEPWGFDRHSAKTLTDEEIRHIQAICHLKDVGYDNFVMRFARAILRKAQEK